MQQYGTNFLNFCESDELLGELPPDVRHLAELCEREPTNLSARLNLLTACQESNTDLDIVRQRFNINSLVILRLLGALPKIQEHLLAAQMGLREEIFQLNELLWRWLTSRSFDKQVDDPKRIKKLYSTASDKIIMLNDAINGQLTEPYLPTNMTALLLDCLGATASFANILEWLQD
jgi:hypothetical protein